MSFAAAVAASEPARYLQDDMLYMTLSRDILEDILERMEWLRGYRWMSKSDRLFFGACGPSKYFKNP